MKIEYRYYVAYYTEGGLLKIAHEEIGPYYNTMVLINRNGYETRSKVMEAVETYIKEYRTRYGYGPTYTFTILEEMTMSEDDE